MKQPMWNAARAIPVILVILALSTSLGAQWPSYPTPGLPKTPDGKPNLAAPAPKTADGKPDLSGVWEPTASPVGPAEKYSDGVSGATFFSAAPDPPKGEYPLTPAGAAIMKKRTADHFKDNPDANCMPLGIMMLHTHPQPRKIFQLAGVVVVLNEVNFNLRQIFTDGRPLPKNPQPWWYGYSTGKWEGDTLVVTTTGLRDDGWLDFNVGAPLSDAATITERWRRVNVGRLEVDITTNDPKMYTKPWTVRVSQRLLPDSELIEHVCNEGQDLTRPKTWK